MWHEIEETMKKAEKSLSEYKRLNKEYAKKEYEYRTALSKRLLQRKTEGYAVTNLSDIVRGEEDIAKLKFERDIAEGLKNSAEKGTDFYKLYAKLMEAQTSREWGQAKFQEIIQSLLYQNHQKRERKKEKIIQIFLDQSKRLCGKEMDIDVSFVIDMFQWIMHVVILYREAQVA